MKQLINFLIFCGMTAIGQGQEKTPELKLSGFSHPESVIFDKDREYFYVSNMADREEGDGFISRLSKNGEIQDLSWISGLNDPKGLLIKKDKLYVTDVTQLVEIDINSGEILKRIKVEGAKSLNDPALDENGDIYFSDLAGNSIFKMNESGEIEGWLSTPELEKPNGLLITPEFILVAAWGENKNGNLLKIDRNTKEISRISKEGIGNLDGIQRNQSGEYYISDWNSGKIYTIDMEGNLKEVLTSEKSSGDILFIEDDNTLYLPMNHQNELWIYKLN